MSDGLVVGRFDDADEIKTTQHRILGYDLTTECIHFRVDLFQPIGIFVHCLPPFGGQRAEKNISWHKVLLRDYCRSIAFINFPSVRSSRAVITSPHIASR